MARVAFVRGRYWCRMVWSHQIRRVSSDTTKSICATITTPVVIVGGGPTGLMLSNLLSSYGTPSVLLEALTPEQRFAHPQAHFLNTRTMEILRHSLPQVHHEVLKQMPPVHQWKRFQWGTSMTASPGMARVEHAVDRPLEVNMDGNGRLLPDGDSKNDNYGNDNNHSTITPNPPLSPCSVGHLAQHTFCRILSEAARQNLLEGSRVGYGVRVKQAVEDYNTNPDFPVRVDTNKGDTVRAKIVVAADGSHSSLRNAWNIDMQGQAEIQNLVNVHIRTSPKLAEQLHSDDNSAMLHFVYNPSVVAVVVCHAVGEYVLQIPFFPPYQTLERDFSPEQVRHMVQAALGVSPMITEDELDIVSVRPWTMSSLIANRYVSGNHCVLAGDAAHVFPPAGGFGMNTGLQDVQNLAWRLSWLVHCDKQGDNGNESGKVLRQYEQERRPVAQQNAALSVRNYHRTLQLAKACYLNDQHPSVLMSMLSSPPMNLVPLETRQAMFQRLVQTAMWPLGSLQYKNSLHGQHMRRNVRQILERGEGLPLLFPKYELGFGYTNNKGTYFAPDGTDWTQDTAGYNPQVRIGHLLPHTVLQVVSPSSTNLDRYPHLLPVGQESDGTVHVTTTDLPSQLRQGPSYLDDDTSRIFPCYALLLLDVTPSMMDGLKDTILKVWTQCGVRVQVVEVLSMRPVSKEDWSTKHLVLLDPKSTLRSMVTSEETNRPMMLLIRPDGHVASIVPMPNNLNTKFDDKVAGSLLEGVQQSLGIN